jgi:integrase
MAVPADAATVALYLTDLSHSLRPSTITRRMAAISVEHQRHGLVSPTQDPRVREIVRGLRRSLGVATREALPARIGEIRRMVAHLPDTLAGTRDRALLLVGFASAMRASELVALDVGDIERRDEGVTLLQRRSKTDQEGRQARRALVWGSDPMTCPIAALDRWLAAAEITDGAVFRSVSRHDKVGPERLTSRAVSLVVKRAAEQAGLDPTGYSAHSLRAGFATTAAANGASERAIANQTGHRSMEVLRRYVRHGTVFTDNAVSTLGL